jgi:hypothetical protein
LKVINRDLIKNLLKNGTIKFDGLFSLPWFLEWVVRDIPTAKIFYITLNSKIIFPVIIIRECPIRIAYMPSPPNFIGRVNEPLSFSSDVIKDINKAINFHVLIVRAHPHDNVSRLRLLYNESCILVHDKADLFVDLKKNITDIFYSFEKRTRYALRRALRLNDTELIEKYAKDPLLGTMIYEENNEEGLKNLSRLLKYQFAKIVLERKGRDGKELLKLQSYYSVENIEKTFEILGKEGLLRLFFAQGTFSKPEACVALFVSKQYLSSPMAYWWLGASTYSAEKKALPTLLQFSIINILKSEGYERYFLGGIKRDFQECSHGPTLFKRGLTRNLKQGFLLICVKRMPFNMLQSLSNSTIFRFARSLVNL